MEKNVEDIKKEFDAFIRSYTHRPKSKYMDILEPFWQHIRKALNAGITKRNIHDFLVSQKIDIKFSTFCSLLRQQKLTKKHKSKNEKVS